MTAEGIIRKQRNRDLILEVDLDYADRHIGKKALYLGIPIFKMHSYSPTAGFSDKYQGVRKWYRNNIDTYGGIIIFHRSDLLRYLSKAQPDAVDYLVTEDEADRNNHEGWQEPDNEAVEIRQWIFPANAINMAKVTSDFIFENIKISVIKTDKLIGEVYYFVKPVEREIYYSHSRQAKRSVS